MDVKELFAQLAEAGAVRITIELASAPSASAVVAPRPSVPLSPEAAALHRAALAKMRAISGGDPAGVELQDAAALMRETDLHLAALAAGAPERDAEAGP